MKKLLEILFCCAFALGIASGCKDEPGGGGGDPTPPPAETAVPVPTEVPTPTAGAPCVFHAQVGAEKSYKGDCAVSATCRNGDDGYFYGSDCQTVVAP